MAADLVTSPLSDRSSTMIRVSVIIPSYNSEKTIAGCIKSVLNQTFPPEEIIVADSSEDHTSEIIKAHFPEVALIHFRQKTDPGTARNAAIQLATGNIIACIDSDCEAHPNWLENMVHLHEAFPDVAAVGGAVLPANVPDDVIGHAGYLAEFREFLPKRKEGFVRHIPTCNISYKSWVFKKYGGYNPDYYPQEDMIFHYDLTSKGEKIFFSPKILVYHHHRSEKADFFRHQKRIGEITAKLIYLHHLKGYFFVRWYPFTSWSYPLIATLKWVNTIRAFPFSYLRAHIRSIPYFSMGMLFWLRGFFHGSRKHRDNGA